MSNEIEVGPSSNLPPGTVIGAGQYAIGNADELFAVSRRCRHLYADLANGTVNDSGCLVCPWHQAEYNVETGRMLRGPQGIFAKVPGLGLAFRVVSRVVPLRRGKVTERDGTVFVE